METIISKNVIIRCNETAFVLTGLCLYQIPIGRTVVLSVNNQLTQIIEAPGKHTHIKEKNGSLSCVPRNPIFIAWHTFLGMQCRDHCVLGLFKMRIEYLRRNLLKKNVRVI